MESDFSACVMAAAQVTAAIASNTNSNATQEQLLRIFAEVLDTALERVPGYEDEEDEEEE